MLFSDICGDGTVDVCGAGVACNEYWMDQDYDGSGDIYYVGSVNANQSHPPINGYIDEFRISKGDARWTSAFTPPTYAYGANQRILSGSVDIS